MKKVKLNLEDLFNNLEDISKVLDKRFLMKINGGNAETHAYFEQPPLEPPYCESCYYNGNTGGGKPSGLTVLE